MATTNAIIPTSTLNGIATAIKAKDGGGNMTAAQMATRIANISTGETIPDEYTGDNTEIDYDFTLSGFQNLDATAYLWLAIVSGATAHIEWGDGATTQLTGDYRTTPLSHTYATRAKYTVKIVTDTPASNGYGFENRYGKLLGNNEIYGGVLSKVQETAVAFVTDVRFGPRAYCSMIANQMPSIQTLRINAHAGLYLGNNDSYPIVGDGRKGPKYVTYGSSGILRRTVRVPQLHGVRLSDATMLDSSVRFGSMFTSCYLLSAVPAVLDVSSGTNFSSMFNNCYSLSAVPAVLDVSSGTNFSSMFCNCSSLLAVPAVLDVSSGTNFSSMFDSCHSLSAVPAVLDVSSGTNFSSMFRNCGTSNMPRAIIPNTSLTTATTLDFSTCNRMEADSVATFDASGNITGGFAAFETVPATYGVWETNCPDYYKNSDGTWKAHASAGKTSDATGAAAAWSVKFPKVVYDAFTATERTAVETACSNHGWTVVWTT